METSGQMRDSASGWFVILSDCLYYWKRASLHVLHFDRILLSWLRSYKDGSGIIAFGFCSGISLSSSTFLFDFAVGDLFWGPGFPVCENRRCKIVLVAECDHRNCDFSNDIVLHISEFNIKRLSVKRNTNSLFRF